MNELIKRLKDERLELGIQAGLQPSIDDFARMCALDKRITRLEKASKLNLRILAGDKIADCYKQTGNVLKKVT